MTQTPQLSRFKFDAIDVEQLQEQLPESRGCVKLRSLSKEGRVSVENVQFSIGSFDIWQTNCGTGVEARLEDPSDSYVIFLPISGGMEVRCRGIDLASNSGCILAGKLQQTEFVRKHAARSHVGIKFSQSVLKRELSLLLDKPVTKDVDLAICIENSTVLHAYLMSLGRLVWSTLADFRGESFPLHSTDSLFRSMLTSMLEQLPHSYSQELIVPKSTAVPRQVKRAIEFMRANVHAPLEIADVSQAAGVSVRALQLAFQQFTNTTPSDYWRTLRLECVRNELLQMEDSTIATIAQRYGFVHMGHFSALYKKAFGELPKETMRKGRNRPGLTEDRLV